MKCQRCGKELGNFSRCEFCGYNNVEGNVREMTNAEKISYDGVTIDTGETSEQNSTNSYTHRTNNKSNYSAYKNFSRRTIYTSSQGIFSRLIDKILFGLMNNDLVVKIAVTLIGVALAALMFFVAIPILFLILATGIALFAFSKLGR